MPNFEIRSFLQPEYQVKEAVNTLCTNLSFAGGDIKKIMITSCHPQEGKSFISMSLLRAFAQLGMRVVLVDADIRASQLQRAYDIRIDGESSSAHYPGLSRYLAGRCTLEDVLGPTSIPNAWMILAGRTVTNSLPLFSTPRLKSLLNALSEKFDVVLVDAPPVGTIIDAAKIATVCDGTLFIVESGTVSRSQFQRALHQIELTGCALLGTVLNQYDDRSYGNKYYYSGYYSSRYRSEEKPRRSSMQKTAFGQRSIGRSATSKTSMSRSTASRKK